MARAMTYSELQRDQADAIRAEKRSRAAMDRSYRSIGKAKSAYSRAFDRALKTRDSSPLKELQRKIVAAFKASDACERRWDRDCFKSSQAEHRTDLHIIKHGYSLDEQQRRWVKAKPKKGNVS